MKEHRGTILVTTAVTLLPMLLGLLLWNRLPAELPIHFGFTGETDGYGSKATGVFLIFGILAAAHLLTAWLITRDPKQGNLPPRLIRLSLWIVPLVSLAVAAMIYPTSLGRKIDVSSVMFVLEGLLFLVFGNNLPKCRPNYTMGIRLPWTLADDENWTKTHRMAGPVWVAGGLCVLLFAFLPVRPAVQWTVFCGVLLLLVLIPSVYSYRLYRKKQKDG